MTTLEKILVDLNGPTAAAAVGRGGQVELEIRLDGADFAQYASLYDQLIRRAAAGALTVAQEQSLNTIRENNLGERDARGPGAAPQAQQIFRKVFLPDGGRAVDYSRKTPLARPARVAVAPGGSFRVALSTEVPAGEFVFERVRYRLKNRLGFELAPGAAGGADPALAPLAGWRVDMTIVRRLDGSAAESLATIVPEMFDLVPAGAAGPPGTRQRPDTLLARMGLRGATLSASSQRAQRALYTYEVELEYTGDPGLVTADGVRAAGRALVHLINPDCLAASQMHFEVARAAGHFMASAALVQRFSSGERGLKQLGPAAVGLTRGGYGEIYPPTGLFLTDKAHGIRALLIVREGRLVLIAPGRPAGDMAEAYFASVAAPTIAAAAALDDSRLTPAVRADVQADTVLDGELVLDGPAEPAPGAPAAIPGMFLAFDVIMLKGARVAERPFEERLGSIAAGVAVARHFGVLDARAKEFVRLSDADPAALERDVRAVHGAARPYGTDGLVLYQPGQPYAATRIHKWKPLEENSIDFLARRPGKGVLGRAPFVDLPGHELHFLFVGASRELYERLGLARCPGYDEMFPEHAGRGRTDYFPLQFQSADQPHAFLYQHPAGAPAVEGRIIELRLRAGASADGHAGTPAPAWELLRVRTDRDEDLRRGRLFGNNYVTAAMTWLNYRDPLTLEMLWQGPGSGYFQALKAGIYEAPTRFVSYAKGELMGAHVAGSSFVVDLGAGRGADLGRYREYRVRNVVMVDRDRGALADLIRRLVGPSKGRGRPGAHTRFHALQADFTAPHAEVAARIRAVPDFPPEGASAVVCNLAAHYAFGTREGVANFALLCAALLRPGGQLILTLLSGAEVFALVRDLAPGESWDARQDGVLKYSVRRLFREKALTAAGQRIGVVLPFSRGEYYEEYLSNVGALADVFRARGLALADCRSLTALYADGFRARHDRLARALTADDERWLALFAAVRFERTA